MATLQTERILRRLLRMLASLDTQSRDVDMFGLSDYDYTIEEMNIAMKEYLRNALREMTSE